MANKRYYWFKFKEDFFKNDSIMYLEEFENGYACIIFLQKICLANLNNEGLLIRKIGKKTISHNAESLSKVTGTDVNRVKEYLNLLIEVGLIEVSEDNIMFIPMLKDSVGSESDSAKRMRKLREKKKQQEELNNNNTNNNKILDKDKDIDKDIEKEKDIEVTSQCDAPKDIDKKIELLFPSSSFKADYRD